MVDPKYADLPGIAYDQPDCYETSDLPEADQEEIPEPENESIERFNLDPSEAIKKFKGKYLNAEKVDFSERLSRILRTGYEAKSGDWELAGEGEKETPLQKYNRLKCEMGELLDEINQLKQNEKEMLDAGLNTSLVKNVEESLKLLNDLKLEKLVGNEIINSLSDPNNTQFHKLIQMINNFKETVLSPEKKAPSKKSEASTSDSVIYDIKHHPEKTKYLQTARVAELEHRLNKLENVLGTTESEKLNRLTTTVNSNNLLDAIQELDAKCSLLESGQLDHIEGRLNSLAQKLETINKQRTATEHDEKIEQMISDLLNFVKLHKGKSQITEDMELIQMISDLNNTVKKMREISCPSDFDKEQKINELYNFVKKSDISVEMQPVIMERLFALDSFHQKALDFNNTLMQLESYQSQLSAGVQNNKSLLQGVQESFAMNFDVINKNLTKLDERVNDLKKSK